MSDTGKPRRRFRWFHLLLIVPYVAILWVPSFNRAEPSIAGIPFFYWYQMLWIVLGAVLLLPVYLIEEPNAKSE
jgi:predicted ferric reductase